jgi:hypothetical protein
MMDFNDHEDRADLLVRFVLLLFFSEPGGKREELVPERIRLEREAG